MLYLCIVLNIKTTNPELVSLITNVCKPPKNFDFPVIVQHFIYVWFEEFPWVCYSCWEDRTYCLSCVLFGYKNGTKSLQKPYQRRKTVKSFKKHQNVLTGTHKKRQIISFHRFAGEYTLSYQSVSSFGKLGRREEHFFKKPSGQKGKGERKCTIYRCDRMFLF